MTGTPLPEECRLVADDLEELALGTLDGRARARALAHVESCPRCAAEVAQLNRVADAVLALAPEAEPPVGFEVRLSERLGVAEPAPRRRGRVVLALAASVVALLIGLGAGLALSGGSMPSGTQSADGSADYVTAGALVDGGHVVGQVATYGGRPTWLFMNVDRSSPSAEVHCVAVLADGRQVGLGSFWLTAGHGTWGAVLPAGAGDVRAAEVVSATGQVLAHGTLQS
jgi:hypothetical protein